MTRKQEIVFSYARLFLLAAAFAVAVAATLRPFFSLHLAFLIPICSIGLGLLAVITAWNLVWQKAKNRIVKLVLMLIFGGLFVFVAMLMLLKNINRLKAYGDDFMTNFSDNVFMGNGSQYHVVARIFVNSSFYSIVQPVPLPRDYKQGDVLVYRMVPDKKNPSSDVYYETTDEEFKTVEKKYRRLQKKGKIKVNKLQKSIDDMTCAELKVYIMNNRCAIRNADIFSDSPEDTKKLCYLINGYEYKIMFTGPEDRHKWTVERLNCILRYYYHEINWDSGIDADCLIKEADKLEVDSLLDFCRKLDNVILAQRENRRGAVSADELADMIRIKAR